MSAKNIRLEQEGGIFTITINRPDKLNALNKKTIQELSHAFRDASKDNTIRVIVLTGSGTKAFVAGADISEFASFNESQGQRLAAEGQALLFDVVEHMNKPVIAAVNGFALGGGLELAMACHVRFASKNAKLGLPEVSLGVIPGYGGTQRLSQLVGKGKAMEMILSAGMIDADEAHRIGLVNHVVDQDILLSSCKEMAKQMMRNSPNAQSAAIRAINAGYKSGLNGFETEINEFGNCFGTEEFIEGTQAFLEKRKPNF
jgi:enoyl-CoA hydratase